MANSNRNFGNVPCGHKLPVSNNLQPNIILLTITFLPLNFKSSLILNYMINQVGDFKNLRGPIECDKEVLQLNECNDFEIIDLRSTLFCKIDWVVYQMYYPWKRRKMVSASLCIFP